MQWPIKIVHLIFQSLCRFFVQTSECDQSFYYCLHFLRFLFDGRKSNRHLRWNISNTTYTHTATHISRTISCSIYISWWVVNLWKQSHNSDILIVIYTINITYTLDPKCTPIILHARGWQTNAASVCSKLIIITNMLPPRSTVGTNAHSTPHTHRRPSRTWCAWYAVYVANPDRAQPPGCLCIHMCVCVSVAPSAELVRCPFIQLFGSQTVSA